MREREAGRKGGKLILFVCRGNQFRSPVAAACANRLLGERGLEGTARAESAGTWTEAGLAAHPTAVEAASRLGLDLSRHRTREVSRKLVSRADLVVVMEEGQQEALEWEFGKARGKVRMLSEVAGRGRQGVRDPAERGFTEREAVANVVCAWVEEGLERMLELAGANEQAARA